MIEELRHKEYMTKWVLQAEYIIAICQLVIAALLSSLYFLSPKPADSGLWGAGYTGSLLILYLTIAVVGLALLRFKPVVAITGWARLFIDITLLTLIIASFPPQYASAPEAALKSPAILYYFVMIGLQAMRFSLVHVITAGAFSVICWLGLVVYMLPMGTITNSYMDYVTGRGLLIGAEVEKMVVLLMCASVLGVCVIRGRSILLQSITSQLNEAKALAEAELYKANTISQAKSDFLAKVSHELRTPMNGIMGITEELKESWSNDSQRAHLEILTTSSHNLLAVIDNILDVTAIENDDIVLEENEISIPSLVNEAVMRERPAALQKGLNFDLEIQDIPLVVGDVRRLKVIIGHLLNNAVKFTESGYVSVTVCAHENNEFMDLHIAVQDTGLGIPTHLQESVFKLFEQADNSKTRARDGLGLGLSISAALIKKMDGQLSFTSTLGQGSTFDLRLSLRRATTPQMEEGDAQPESAFLGEKSSVPMILAAEDNKMNQMVLKALIDNDKWGIRLADDGVQAVKAYQTDDIDLVLMDLSMPNMDGITAAVSIREYEKQHGISPVPILALTAHISDETRQQCLASGMNDYLTKPINKTSLIAALSRNWADKKPVAA